MTCPVDGEIKITDQYDAQVNNPLHTTVGAGSITYVDNPDSEGISNKVMLLSAPAVTAGVRDEAKLRYRPRRATARDQVISPGANFESNFNELYGYQKGVIITPTMDAPLFSGVQMFYAESPSATVVFNLQFVKVTSEYRLGYFNFGGSNATTTTSLPLDEEFELRWHYKASTGSNGILRVDVKRQSDEDWVTAVNLTNHTTTHNIQALELRCRANSVFANGTYGFGVVPIEFGLHPDGWDEIDGGYEDFKACFVSGATQTEATFNVNGISPDRYRDGSYYRVNYGTTTALGTTTAWALLKGWNPGSGERLANKVGVTDLTPGTRYYWRVELADSASPSGVTLTSDTFTFQTAKPVGDRSTLKAHFGCCSENDGKLRPFVGYELLDDNIDMTELAFAVHSGDLLYEASQAADPDRYAPETEEEYLVFYKEAFECKKRAKYLHSTVVYISPGDHAVYNNANGVGESTDNVSLIKDHPLVGGNYDPASPSTYQDVWDAALPVYDAWIGNSPYNQGDGYTHYVDYGSTRLIVLDNLLTGDFDNNIFFGEDQINWLKARCAEVAPGTTIIIASDTAWGPVNVQTDSVDEVAPNETKGFNEWAETPGNVADGVKIIIIEGDTHRGWYVGKSFYNTSGALMANTKVLAFNALFSPIAQTGAKPSVRTDASTIAAFDVEWWSVGQVNVTSGGVLTLGDNLARLQAWSADDQTLDTQLAIGRTNVHRLRDPASLRHRNPRFLR